jgi:hypothetical protein
MKKGLFDRRIPTVLALLVLVAIIGISTFLIQSGVFYVGKAAPDSQPQNFSITNITDTSFTAVFTTTGNTDAVITMKEGNTGSTLILDDRDKKSGTQNKYYSHHITVPNLAPQQTYTFSLIVGGTQYQSSAYKVTTGSKIAAPPPSQNPLFGKVLLPDGAMGTDSIVISNTNGSQNISSITDSKGEFILPTNSLRNTANNEYVLLNDDSSISLKIFRQAMTATITTVFKTAQNLPTVTLLQQYNFIEKEDEEITGGSSLNFVVPVDGETIDIITPKEGESFIDHRPEFKGTAFPNSTVDIRISKLEQQMVKAKVDGSWSYQHPTDLAIGKYTLTISALDSDNQKVTLTRNFTILQLGSQVVGDPRPTTSPTPLIPTPTKTPTLTPTKTPTPTPTQ